MIRNESFPNTDNFYEILDCEFARARRYGIDVTLFFIKLGQVEEIARKYGRLIATRILKDISQLICQNIRQADRGFVYGSGEFMLILPYTSKSNAHCLISKLKPLIENYSFTDSSGGHFTFTPRFGVSSYHPDVQTGKEWRSVRK